MTAEVIIGDLFESDAKYLCHQTNCVTNAAAHLAAAVFKKYPYSNIYKGRLAPDPPGEIIIRGDGIKERFIINMCSQYYPGSPQYPDSPKDGYKARERYFFECLKKISALPDLHSVAFPWTIGCGAAGGNWEAYHKLLDKFAEHVKDKATVRIYKLPGL